MAESMIQIDDISIKVPEFRLLLVGRTGAGKSATGNSILGRSAFPTSLGLQSQTIRTQCAEQITSGRRFVVADTPGFFDTSRSNDFIMQELIKIFGFLAPGFHALIYVMGPDRFTKECIKTKDLFLKTFGPGVAKYTVILVTGLDRIESDGKTFQNFISSGNADFRRFLAFCENRIIAFNNKAKGDEMSKQMQQLLDMIDDIQRQTGNKCFTNLHFQTMKMYKKTRHIFGKDKIDLARKTLFKKIAQRYGVDHKYAWGPETQVKRATSHGDKTTDLVMEIGGATGTGGALDIDIETEAESYEEFDKWNFDDVEVDINDVADRAELSRDPSYLNRIIRYFSRLFQPLHDVLFKST